jgi:hypothetical protein
VREGERKRVFEFSVSKVLDDRVSFAVERERREREREREDGEQ